MNIKKIAICVIVFFTIAFLTVHVLRIILKRPVFSIIISVYNYADYLPDTIESILASTYPDYEIIIVNDGSTDNSLEVMQYYAAKDKRIKLISQENQGLSIARNNAMKQANGKYFWFVDADDFIDVKALEKLAIAIEKSAQKNNRLPDIVSFIVQMVNDKGRPIGGNWYAELPKGVLKYKINQYDGGQLPMDIVKWFPVTSGKQIYRADYLLEKNIIFPPRLVFEDDCFFLTTILSGAKGIVVAEKLYYKRAHDRSIVHNRAKYYDSVVRLPMVIYQNLKERGVSDEVAQEIFGFYADGVYSKWPAVPKFISDLETLLQFMKNQPSHEFWKNRSEKLHDFIQQKKTEMNAK